MRIIHFFCPISQNNDFFYYICAYLCILRQEALYKKTDITKKLIIKPN